MLQRFEALSFGIILQKKLSGFEKNCRRSSIFRDGKRGFEIRAAKRTTHSVKRRKYDFYTPSRCLQCYFLGVF